MHVPVICDGKVKEAVLKFSCVGLEAQEIQLALQITYTFEYGRP